MTRPRWFILLISIIALGVLAAWLGALPSTAAQISDQSTHPTFISTPGSKVAVPQLSPCPGSWSLQAAIPISLTEQAVVSVGGAVYSFGGYDGSNPLNAAYKYTPATNSWTGLEPLPAARADAQAVNDGTYIYILGGGGPGQDETDGTTTLWRYNPATDSYTTLAPSIIPTFAHGAAYLNGKIYRIAGCTPFSAGFCFSSDAPTNSVEVYTLANNTWAAAAPYPERTAYLRAIGYGGFVYAAGGFYTYGKTYRYDPATDRWDDTAIADLPTADSTTSASDLLNGRWVLAGGYVNGSADGALSWNPVTNIWEPLPPLMHGETFGSGAAVGSAFYVIGGDEVGSGLTSYNQRYLETPCTTPTATPPIPPPTPTPTPTVCGVGRWQQVAAIPNYMIANALVGHSGRLYSFGGTYSGVYTATYSYDPATDIWTPRAPLPAPRAGARTVSDGSYIYILGGIDDIGNTPTNTLWRYDPVANTYTTLAPYTIPTSEHAAVVLTGKIYRIGGLSSGGNTASVEVYTIATNSWTTAANYPQALNELAAVAVNGYIYGGGGYNSPATAKTYRYDPATNTWDDAAVPDLPDARWGAATGVYNGRWLIAAGGGSSTPTFPNLFAWTPGANAWTALPDLSQGRLLVAGATLPGGFYVHGGYDDYARPTTGTQRYSEPACATTPTPQPTVCALTFVDVPTGSTFYDYVRCLACRGIVNGYPCGGPGEPCPGAYFRPNNNVTRGQVAKIVTESARWADPVPSSQQTFADVAPASTFWLWVERLVGHGIIGGYPCGGPGEPCQPPTNRPYFRPNANVTRGQLSKIVSGGAGYSETATTQTFEDVPPTATFYLWVERLSSRGIIGGYPCGGGGEPCVAPGNRPYFRPNNPATRSQLSKIAATTFFPGCVTPARR